MKPTKIFLLLLHYWLQLPLNKKLNVTKCGKITDNSTKLYRHNCEKKWLEIAPARLVWPDWLKYRWIWAVDPVDLRIPRGPPDFSDPGIRRILIRRILIRRITKNSPATPERSVWPWLAGIPLDLRWIYHPLYFSNTADPKSTGSKSGRQPNEPLI